MVNPNIGHPLLVDFSFGKERNKFKTSLLFVTNLEDPISVKYELSESLKLVPILEYKWKLTQLLKEKEDKRIKRYIRRIKTILSRKKKTKGREISLIETDKDGKEEQKSIYITKNEVKKIEYRAFRGESLHPVIIDAKEVKFSSINDPNYIENEYIAPQINLSRLGIYEGLNFYYIVNIEFSLSKEILDFLEENIFIMFDIFNRSTEFENNINFHSLVISKNDWNNINVVQATDLHLAKRNDFMYTKINSMYNKLLKTEGRNENGEKNKIDSSHDIEISIKRIKKLLNSFPKRLINPNDFFREFIKSMNQKVLKNELDFIIISGDIVDFAILSDIDPENPDVFHYENSNWKIFKEMLLGINQNDESNRGEMKELLCPIFTILGNHDFRPWQYDLSWGGIHKKMGLTKEEAEILRTQYSVSPIKAITKTDHAIKAYLSKINPSLNFHLCLNNHIFIFLNCGPDSYVKIKSFIMGKPSLMGISNTQVYYLKNLINKYGKGKYELILILHAPPINPRTKRNILTRFKKLFKGTIKTNLDDFKETKFKKILKRESKARIDDKFDITIGTFSSNRETILKYCLKYFILTLSGHTHSLKEFRLVNTTKDSKNEGQEEEFKVFYDDYSTLYQNSDNIGIYGPFIVQTPALGLKAYKGSEIVGSYREIKIKDGKLASFLVKNVRN